MKNKKGLFRKLACHRNTIFLYMCLGVHISYLITFAVLGITPFALINSLSTLFYIFFIAFSKERERSEKTVVAAYFEIIGFAMISELFTRGTFGFIFFVLGMIPVIFYLAPSYRNKRFTFQVMGIISAMIIHHSDVIVPESFFSEVFERTQQYSILFSFINLIITLFTVLYTSLFYEMELDMVRSELDYNCTHDALTGLYNRRYLYDMIKESDDESAAVALLDIDNFKKINDRFGHDTGDDILAAVSSCLSEDAENSDLVPVRWGGEEFVVYFRNTDTDTAYRKISEICSRISEKAVLPDSSHVTVTAGLVHGKKTDFDKAVKKADEYLYLGKQNGKNCIIWHQNESQYSSAV